MFLTEKPSGLILYQKNQYKQSKMTKQNDNKILKLQKVKDITAFSCKVAFLEILFQ